MFGTKSGKYIRWNRSALKKLTVADLVGLAVRLNRKKSFKDVVIDYLVEIGPPKTY